VTEIAVQGRLQRARVALRKEWRMVEKHFKENRLRTDFAAQIQRLLNTIAASRDGRWEAFRRLAALGEPAVEPLRTALDDQRDGVRRAAAVALCNRGDCHGLQYVLRLLYAPDWTPSRFHLEQAMEIPGLRASFLEAAAGGDQRQRWTALRALATIEGDDAEASARFDSVFRDSTMDTRSRVYALRALGRIGGEAGLAVVGEALADSDPQVFDQGLRLAGEEKLLPAVGICRRAFGRRATWRKP
jgi:HEAT repeat protein